MRNRDLARLLRDIPWERDALLSLGKRLLRADRKWWVILVDRWLEGFPKRPVGRRCLESLVVSKQLQKALHDPKFRQRLFKEQTAAKQRKADNLRFSGLPRFAKPEDIADWLGVPFDHLKWIADPKGLTTDREAGPLQHYRRRWLSKPRGGFRLLESPKDQLKRMQRKLLEELLMKVPLHDAAHAFRPSRSIRTHAGPHVGREIVLKLDLRDFFPSFTETRLAGFFRWLNYPDDVAWYLTCLCTTITPLALRDKLASPEARQRFTQLYARRHLPQGAPTSPALANLLSHRMDLRLTGLAKRFDAVYNRYADDLTFSGGGELRRRSRRFLAKAGAVCIEEGFEVAFHKTRVMNRSVRQQTTGLVLNEKLNTPREEYDLLKAILHNAVKHGLESQNRETHPHFAAALRGRIEHVRSVNPQRGERLLTMWRKCAAGLDQAGGA